MIKTRKDLRFYLAEDKKYYEIPFSWRFGIMIGNEKSHAWRLVRALRLYEYALNNSKTILGRIRLVFRKIRYSQLRFKTGIYLPPNTIGYGLCILHFNGGIYVNAKSIGNHCILTSGVTVGAKEHIDKRPVIGNNVNLTLGCKIIGDIKLGNNVTVAPNSVVIKDVPDNAVVSGVPSTIIKINQPSNLL